MIEKVDACRLVHFKCNFYADLISHYLGILLLGVADLFG